MIYILLYLAFSFLDARSCLAQKQANVWFFGNHAGVDFNSGTPVGIAGGQTYLQQGHAEGTAVICDSSGKLLFYTNGEKIWNRQHQIMQNGDSILGSYSSTQSSLILPLPGNEELFYLFTTDAFYVHNLQYGFRYSVVDICLDNGFWGVVEGQKNIHILDTVSEKLTAVRHSNGIDYWVIVHKYFSDTFYAYLFTTNGIVDTVITQIGSTHDFMGQTGAAIGYMKASPNGNRIALASINGGNLRELFDFDASTGTLSNYLNLQLPNETFPGGYGISFSPDNSKLYVEANIGRLYQYNLLAGGSHPDSIRSSKYELNLHGTYSCAIQLGPDGKLYTAAYTQPYLSVIEYPNLPGAACGFNPNAIQLPGGVCNYGLPNIVDSYSYSNGIPLCPVAIEEALPLPSITVHPNPASDRIRIELPDQKVYSLAIKDALGRLVQQVVPVSGYCEVDCGGFTKGIYFIQALGEESVLTARFVKE